MDILSYGISMTTLEEVFLKVNGDLEEDDQKPSNEDRSSTLQGPSDDEGVLISEERKTNENIAG